MLQTISTGSTLVKKKESNVKLLQPNLLIHVILSAYLSSITRLRLLLLSLDAIFFVFFISPHDDKNTILLTNKRSEKEEVEREK